MVAEGGRARARRGRREPSRCKRMSTFFLPSFCFARATQRGWRLASGEVLGELAAPLRRAAYPTTLALYTAGSAACTGTFGSVRSEAGASTFESSSGVRVRQASVLPVRPRGVRCGVLSLGPSESGFWSLQEVVTTSLGLRQAVTRVWAPLCLTRMMMMPNARETGRIFSSAGKISPSRYGRTSRPTGVAY